VNTDPTDDTGPEALKLLIEGYRKMTPSQKLGLVASLIRTVRRLALIDVRRRYPDADERELQLRAASRWLDPELMSRAYDWDPREKGF
jgi:hypothetical protein